MGRVKAVPKQEEDRAGAIDLTQESEGEDQATRKRAVVMKAESKHKESTAGPPEPLAQLKKPRRKGR